ncbi:MAG: hypothetical protein J0M02_02330 [Planctomycetes bacterium]|nr:hypothetical protein [Planctomycetota bacterium]
MIQPNPDFIEPVSDIPDFDGCTITRLAWVGALHRAITLLKCQQRTDTENTQLLHAATTAVECAAVCTASADHPSRLIADLIHVQALTATGQLDKADRVGRRLWTRTTYHVQVRADLALTLVDCAKRRNDAIAIDHWSHLAAISIGVAEPSPARHQASVRLAVLGRSPHERA